MSQYPTSISLDLADDKKYIEFGGGARPVVRAGKDVRVDVRPCNLPDGSPAVDFCVDMELPFTSEHNQAISSQEFDGLVSVFALEHVSWRKTPQVLKEFHRILKSGAGLLLVLPNTQAQMEHLLKTSDWGDGGSMLFGGQDYGENAHKAFFTPRFVTQLLQEAGFTEVQVHPYGEKGTDMIVTATARSVPIQHVTVLQEVRSGHLRSGDTPSKESDDLGEGRIVKWNEEQTKYLYERLGETALTRNEVRSTPPQVDLDTLRASRKAMFSRQYFDGGLEQGGGYHLYLDFPCHELTFQHVMARRPESVLELGCGRGYILKRLEDAGVPCVGWDISRHCHLSRVSDAVHLKDATDTVGAGDVMDLCFSIAFLDHVPEELLPPLIEGMKSKCKRGLHGINFDPAGGDSTRCTCRPREWWQKILPEGHEVVDKNELEGGQLPESYFRGDGKVKLNLGSHLTMFHKGWINVDLPDLSPFARQQRYEYKQHDLREGLPWATGSVDLIFFCHALEHLTYQEGYEVLRECRRVLKPSGALRVIVPDTQKLTECYNIPEQTCQTLDKFDELSRTCTQSSTSVSKLQALLCEGHKSLYDQETLEYYLTRAGFDSRKSGFRGHGEFAGRNHMGLRQMLHECLDVLPEISLYVDAIPAPLKGDQ